MLLSVTARGSDDCHRQCLPFLERHVNGVSLYELGGLASFMQHHVFELHLGYSGASLVAQMVKRLPAVRETQVQPLGREDPLGKEMATRSSTLA